MNLAEIESDLQAVADAPFDASSFVFGFLEAYKAANATISKLKQGSANQAKLAGDGTWAPFPALCFLS